MFVGFKECLKVPCVRWNLAGSFFRYGANAVGMGYGLFYFNQYNRATLFSVLQTTITLVGGSFSNLFYGYLSDKLEPKNIKIKAYLSAIQSIFGATCYFFVYYFNINFWFAVTFITLESFLAEGIIAPSISMMTSTAPRGQEENVMGLYMIVSNLAVLIVQQAIGLCISSTDPINRINIVLTIFSCG